MGIDASQNGRVELLFILIFVIEIGWKLIRVCSMIQITACVFVSCWERCAVSSAVRHLKPCRCMYICLRPKLCRSKGREARTNADTARLVAAATCKWQPICRPSSCRPPSSCAFIVPPCFGVTNPSPQVIALPCKRAKTRRESLPHPPKKFALTTTALPSKPRDESGKAKQEAATNAVHFLTSRTK